MDGFESRRGVPFLVKLFVFGGGAAIVVALTNAIARSSGPVQASAGMIAAAIGWAVAGAFILKEVARQSIASVASHGIDLEEWALTNRVPFLQTKRVHVNWTEVQSITQTGILLSFTSQSRRRSVNLRYFDDPAAVVAFAMERWRLTRAN